MYTVINESVLVATEVLNEGVVHLVESIDSG